MITFAQHQFSPSTLTFILEGTDLPLSKVIADLKDAPFNANYAQLLVDKRGNVIEEKGPRNGGDIHFWHIPSPDFVFSAFGIRWGVLVVNFRSSPELAVLFKVKYCSEQGEVRSWHLSLFSSHSAIFEHALGGPLGFG